jgi:preprotein translocase subunit SecA
MNRISRSISLLLSDWFPSRIDPSHLMEMILSSREITKNSHTQQWPSLIALLAERRKLTADWPLPLSIVGPALAWVDESAYRSIGIRLYPVQFLAAYAILSGHIAEIFVLSASRSVTSTATQISRKSKLPTKPT